MFTKEFGLMFYVDDVVAERPFGLQLVLQF